MAIDLKGLPVPQPVIEIKDVAFSYTRVAKIADPNGPSSLIANMVSATAPDDQTVVYRSSSGYILTGPEYLTVFDGISGAELATVSFQPARGAVVDWGDTYGNRVDNFLSTAAFVRDQSDGTASGRPSIIMGRGFYARTAISAWNWRNGALTLL